MKCFACSEPATSRGFCETCYTDLFIGCEDGIQVAEKLVATINELRRCGLNTCELIVSEYNVTIAAQHDTIQRQQQRIAELEALFGADQRISIDALTNRIAELEFDNATYKKIIADWQIKLPAEQGEGALYSEGCGL